MSFKLHFHFFVQFLSKQGTQYAHWAPALRRFWKQGLNRVYAFWFVFVSMTIVVSTAISTDYVNWDRVNRDFVASNELARAFLASFILVMDLMIVMQVGSNYDKNKSRLRSACISCTCRLVHCS